MSTIISKRDKMKAGQKGFPGKGQKSAWAVANEVRTLVEEDLLAGKSINFAYNRSHVINLR